MTILRPYGTICPGPCACGAAGWRSVRKNGVLKRLNATPLTAVEYLSAQMVSRMFALMVSLVMIWAGCEMLIDFNIYGSLTDLFIIFLVGSACMTALGLVVASRGTSEEFANGLLNFICWPMMFLSEVWFSIEGAPGWLRAAAHLFPLTPLLNAARRVMNEGAGLTAVMPEIGALGAMTACFLIIGAAMFAWNK